MSKKGQNIVFVVGFIGLVGLPMLAMWLPILPENRNTENRVLTSQPDIPASLKEAVKLPGEFQNYFNDHFGGRSVLFDLNMSLKSALSSKPFKDNKLVIGKDGWYFSNFQKVIDDYRAVRPFTSGQLEAIKNQIASTKSYLNAKGIKYYLMIVPNKHTVYSDKLPDYIKKVGNKTRLEQLMPSLETTGVNLIDIRDAMVGEKDEKQLYFKTDSHWNLNGSFIGYTQLMNRLKQDFPELKAYDATEFTVSSREIKGGDIVAMMGKEDDVKGLFFDYTPKFETSIDKAPLGDYSLPAPKIFHPKVTVSAFEGGNTPLKAVVFKDSYGGYMEQFLNLHFARTVYVWGHDYMDNKEIVEKENPNVVIQVIVERYIYSLLDAGTIEAQ